MNDWQSVFNRYRKNSQGGIHLKKHQKSTLNPRRCSLLKRINVGLSMNCGQKLVKGNVILLDVKELGMKFYCSEPLSTGKKVRVLFEYPLRIVVDAAVVHSSTLRNTAGLQKGANQNSHRISLEFQFDSKETEMIVQDFCRKVRDSRYVPTRWHAYTQKENK